MGTLSAPPEIYFNVALKSLEQLPTFTPVLQKLLSSILNENVSFAELAGLVEKDTVLTSYVLRLVNSAAYGCRGTVTSVGHAISLMGVSRLRNALISFSVCQMWSRLKTPRVWSMMSFNMHCFAVGSLADVLAVSFPVMHGEGAFVAGMLHDLGKLLIATALPTEFEAIREKYLSTDMQWFEAEQAELGLDHAALGQVALERWNLPEAIRLAVARHHQEEPLGDKLPLSRVIQFADRYVSARGWALFEKAEALEPEAATSFAFQGMPAEPDRLAKAVAQFERDIKVALQSLQ